MPRPCEICGSRRWRKSASGLVACEEGHILQNYRQEESTMDAPSQFALTRRTIRKNNRVGPKVRRGKGVFTGQEEAYLRLEVLQLLLRSQVEAARKLWCLGEEIEMLARDLWIIVLSLYPMPPPPEEAQLASPPPPPIHTSSSVPNLASHAANISRSNTAPNLNLEKPDPSGSSSSESSSSSSSSLSASETASTSSREIIDRLSDDSRTPSDAGPTSPRPRPGRHRTSTAQRHGFNPGPNARITPSVVLRILIMSLWMARVPVTLSDVVRAVSEGKVPYMDWGRRTVDDMRERMSKGLKGMSPKRPPSIANLYQSLVMLADRLERHRGIRLPDANVPLLLWRLTREIGGTPTLYTHTCRLLQRLDISMSVARPNAYSKWYRYKAEKNRRPSASGVGSSEDAAPGRVLPKRRLAELCPVELRLAAALIVTLKLAYGLDDDTPRIPIDLSDPAVQLPRADAWLRELRSKWETGWFRRHVVSREPIDFAYRTPEAVDEFLVQAARVLDVTSRMPDRQQIINLFPLEKVTSSAAPTDEVYEAWRGYHSRAELNLPITTPPANSVRRTRSKPLEPGQAYKVFDWRRPEDLPRDLALIVSVVSEIVGLDRRQVLKEVYAFEMLLQAANRKLRGREQVAKRKRRASSAVSTAFEDGSGT